MRLIDGDALQRDFERLAANEWNKDTVTTCSRAFKESAERVEDALTAGAIDVVRCKDCEHSYEDTGGLWCSYGICLGCIVEGDWFCADGERRTE